MSNRDKKEALIGFFSVLFSILSWYFLRRLFRLEEIRLADYVLTAFMFIIFLGIYSLLCFLSEKWRTIIAVSFFSAFSFFLSFHFNWYNIFIAFLFFLGLLGNFGKVKTEKADWVSLHVFRSLRHTLFWSLIVLFAFISLSYYSALEVSKEEVKVKLPPLAIKATSNYLITLFSAHFFRGASFGAETTVDNLIQESLKNQFENPAYNALSENEKQRLIEEQIPVSRTELSRQVGFDISGNEKMTEIILRASNKKLNQFIAPYKSFMPLILAFSLFITLFAVSPIVKWLSIFTAFIIFKILVAVKFIKIEKIQKEVEIANLD